VERRKGEEKSCREGEKLTKKMSEGGKIGGKNCLRG